MKVARQVALISIIAISVGLQAADFEDQIIKPLSAGEIKELIYKRDVKTINHMINWEITAEQLAALSLTQFPDGSTTRRETSSDGYVRTLADEAVEQAMHDEDTKNAEKFEQSRLVLARLAQVEGVSFNPTKEALEKQRNYVDKFGVKAPLKNESLPYLGIACYFAKELVRTNPKQALEGMDELPPCWFIQAENNQALLVARAAYKLLVKVPVNKGSRSSRVENNDDSTWFQKLRSSLPGGKNEPPKAPPVESNYISVGGDFYYKPYTDHFYLMQYAFPTTNVSSSDEWEKIALDEYNEDQVKYNYYVTEATGEIAREQPTYIVYERGTVVTHYRQEKKLGQHVKHAK